ncbi:MAG: motility associated factor glycosyltransferase family protein [Spirochaetes bacterium]|nr:motility associated factor glycosyltransferase family protein [Spirochaetota bacterium]
MNINKIKYIIEPSKQGLPTLYVTDKSGKKIYLHSRYNPLKEAENIKEKFLPEKFDAIIILGAGFGYHLLALKDIKEKYNKIFIIDIIRGIENEIAKNQSTSFLAKSDKIKFISGMNYDEIENILSMGIDFNRIRGLDVIEHAASFLAFGWYYDEVKKIVCRLINKKAANIATRRAFGALYLKNIFKNFNSFSLLYPVSVFFNTMKDYPVIVIASGPGIENQLKELKINQNKFFIIAADSMLKTLTQSGIIPDFFLSIDPQAYTIEHVFEMKAAAVPIFTVSSSPLIIKRYESLRGLISLNTHPVAQIAEDMYPNVLGSTDSGTGTVAGDAVKTAIEFGFSTVGLAGFDFAFHDFKIYPRGSAYQKRFLNSSFRFNTIETINFNYVMRSSKGLKYKNKFTRKSFIQYKDSLEKLIKNYNNIININNTGIPIQGIKHADLNYFINNYCNNDIDKKNIINNKFNQSKNTSQLVSYKKIKDLILKNNIFTEIINASLDANTAAVKGSLLRQLFENISTEEK